MNNLKGKKLLVMGGNAISCDIVTTAQEMGVYVIVTDWNDADKSPAKKIADEAWQISLADCDAIVKKIGEVNVDGVLTGFTDSYFQYYYDVCKAANLPCYGNPHLFGIGSDKMLFKEACRKAGVGVIPGDTAKSFEKVQTIAEEIGYPLILKPVDNSGSRGVIKCEKEEKLSEAFDYAMSYSPSKNLICEKFMDCDCIGISYQLDEGVATLAMVGDKHSFPKSGSFTTSPGSTYPSKYLNRFINEVDPVCKMFFANEGFKTGIASFEAFVGDTDEGVCLVEMCYRPSGGQHYIMIEDATGVNGLKLLIEYAINGKLSDYSSDRLDPHFKNIYVRINIPGTPGKTIARMEGVKELEKNPNIIKTIIKHYVGDTIGAEGTSAQMLFALFYKCEKKEDIKTFIAEIEKTVTIEDEDGNSLIQYDGLEELYK